MRMGTLTRLVFAFCGLLLVTAAQAEEGGILSDRQVAAADLTALKSDAALFEQIKDGVMLSLAVCEEGKPCTPTVNADEVQRILFKLDARITTLSTRYDKTREPGLDQVLLTYADARKGYARALDLLDSIPGESEDTFDNGFQPPATGAPASGGGDPFSDVGDDL